MGARERSPLLTVPEFARLMGSPPSRVRKMILCREIPVVKIGRSVRLRAEDLDSLIRRGLRPALRPLDGGGEDAA